MESEGVRLILAEDLVRDLYGTNSLSMYTALASSTTATDTTLLTRPPTRDRTQVSMASRLVFARFPMSQSEGEGGLKAAVVAEAI